MKKAVILPVLFYISCLTLTAANTVKIRLPVRAFDGTRPVTGLKKEDVVLFINDSRSPVENFIKREKSIGRKADLGRQFVLSFSMMEYGSQFEKAIAYLITEILRPMDSLIVLSPLKSFPVKIIADKMKMTREIAGLLKKDCFDYSQKRIAEEKHLLEMIRKLTLRFLPNFYGNRYVETLNFLETFPPEFLKFKEHFLLPAVDRYRRTIALLNSREGERWWIHFQEHGINILLQQINQAVRRASRFSWGARWQEAVIHRKILKFKKELLKGGGFSEEEFLTTLLNGNFCFNTVFPGRAKAKTIAVNNKNSVTAGVEEILEKIAIYSGGTAIRNSKFDQALRKLKTHVDCYYDVEMSLDTGVVENNIRLELTDKHGKATLIYRDNYNKDELFLQTSGLTTGKVKISGFSREENIIRFSIGAFKLSEDLEKKEKFGLLKVEVKLVDPRGVTIYERQNTLRASREQLDITLLLPLDGNGEYKISLSVYDLIANNKTTYEQEIVL